MNDKGSSSSYLHSSLSHQGKAQKGDADPELQRRTSNIADVYATPSIENAESLAAISAPPIKEEEPPSAVIYHPFSFQTLSGLIPGSIFGVLARLGLLSITGYDGHSIFPLAWVQGAGCLVMGFTLELKEPIGEFYGPLYTAITTGFCGSLTTFSSWQLDVFSSWANTEHAHHDWFRNVIDGIGKTIFTLAISLSAVSLGAHVARSILGFLPRFRPLPVPASLVVSVLCILSYAATLPTYFLLSPSFRHEATAAILFAFPGTLTRYVLAITVTPRLKFLPLGTFIANTFGTALLGMFHILQRTPILPSQNACALLQGLSDGYCGCLTTVSTFAVEVGTLRSSRAWVYVILSWGISQLLLLVILGSSWWAGNINDSTVCTFASG